MFKKLKNILFYFFINQIKSFHITFAISILDFTDKCKKWK